MGYIPGTRPPRTKKSVIPATSRADSAPVRTGSVQISPSSNQYPAIMTQSPYTPAPQQGGHHHDLRYSGIFASEMPIDPAIAIEDDIPVGLYSSHNFQENKIQPYSGFQLQNYSPLSGQAFGHSCDKPSEPVLHTAAPESQVTHLRQSQIHANGTQAVSFRLPLPTEYFL
jgi:hypothetical protein